MKILILGCNGMAGHMISIYMKEHGHEVFGFDRQNSIYIPSLAGDALDTISIKTIINEGNYDAVINCIGILNQYAEQNKALAIFLNSYFPHFLSEIIQETTTQLIHMSTDCVFSGQRGSYTEMDLRDGFTFYDRSKALGEIEDEKNITLRNSIVGPDINSNGIGLLNWFLNQKGKIFGYTASIWTGQTTLQLAKMMEAAIMTKAHGLYNAVPSFSINKYELLCLFNKYFRNNTLEIIPKDGIKADKSLERTRFDFDYIVPDYEFMVEELAEWVFSHKQLYPHYNFISDGGKTWIN